MRGNRLFPWAMGQADAAEYLIFKAIVDWMQFWVDWKQGVLFYRRLL